MRPSVLVTGGTGFVGAALVRALVTHGHPVHVLARASSPREVLEGVPVTWHAGDLEDPASVADAVAALVAADPLAWVAHSGAVISYRTRDAALQQRVNVGGTRAVIQACLRSGVARLLHLSSVVAVGHTGPDEVADESLAFNGARLACDYVDTKRAAEELVLTAAGELDVVVVNPGAIFGPNPRGGNTARFLAKLARGRLGPFAPPGSLSVVGVEDVALGCLLALERGRRGRRYLLVESALGSLELFGLAARLLGVPPPGRTCPALLWRSIELGASALDRVRPLDLAAPQTLRMLGAHFRFHADRARAELGWRPRPFEDVLRETIDGLRARGRL